MPADPAPRQETREQHDFRVSQAEKAMEKHAGAAARSFDAQLAFAKGALQMMSFAAGGRIAAVLAFLSANWDQLKAYPMALAHVNKVLLYLFFSLLVTVAAALFSYLCQSAYTHSVRSQTYTWQHPYIEETNRSRRYGTIAVALEWLVIGLGIVAIILLAIGAYWFYRVINP